ncbi:NUDIX hydrolase [Staphylococcus sp. 17KM0847]|uniref:NUDIX hydrolase n=1 Tax=Staphylococcus sp. 17KM0847 TaxID=2583989 RepID=UPI0015E0108D|nr:NUDIX hydrolase [Staphylococcus sp. 17KM0847]
MTYLLFNVTSVEQSHVFENLFEMLNIGKVIVVGTHDEEEKIKALTQQWTVDYEIVWTASLVPDVLTTIVEQDHIQHAVILNPSERDAHYVEYCMTHDIDIVNNPTIQPEGLRFSVEVILEHRGRYLICQRHRDATVAPSIWNVPAGKVKFNEPIEAAMLRETKEETNLTLETVHYLGHLWINNKHQRLVFTYYAQVDDITSLKIDDEEFETYEWVTPQVLDQYSSLNPHIVTHIQQLGAGTHPSL